MKSLAHPEKKKHLKLKLNFLSSCELCIYNSFIMHLLLLQRSTAKFMTLDSIQTQWMYNNVVLCNQSTSFDSCWPLIHSFIHGSVESGGGGERHIPGKKWLVWVDKPCVFFFNINDTKLVINPAQSTAQPVCVRVIFRSNL